MVEKNNRGVIFYAIHWYAKASNNYMKDYNREKEHSYLKYIDRIWSYDCWYG